MSNPEIYLPEIPNKNVVLYSIKFIVAVASYSDQSKVHYEL